MNFAKLEESLIHYKLGLIFLFLFLKDNNIAYPYVNFLMHVMNSAIMFIDILIVAHPMRLYHVVQPFAFMTLYAIYTYLYQICGGVDK